MGRPKNTGSSKNYPKASAIKSSPNRAGEPNHLASKERTSPFDASAALKLRPDLFPHESADETPVGEKLGHPIFESLDTAAAKNKLSVVEPTTSTRVATVTEQDTIERAPHSQKNRASGRPEPTLSPSAVGRLQKKTRQEKTKESKAKQNQSQRRSRSEETAGSSFVPSGTRVTKVASTSAEERARKAKTASGARTQLTQLGDLKRPSNPASSTKIDGQDQTSARALLMVAIAVALGIVYFLTQPSNAPRGHAKPRYSPEEANRMVQLHRFETGIELNQGRVDVEHSNFKTAPPLPGSATKQRGTNLMDGVPLVQENDLRTTSRDRLEPANPNDPDHRVQYILQDEQSAEAWEQEAKREYVRTFIRNARDAGLEVKVRDNMDVEVKRMPDSSADPGQRGAGHSSR